MRPGWYILVYHDVSWELNPYLRGIGLPCPPDLLRAHLQALDKYGRLASPDAAFADWRAGRIDRPTFSFWFDDGFAGVRTFALPILRQYGITGAVSACSRFIHRSEFFWRFKVSFLNSCDGVRILRSRLKKYGYAVGGSVKQFTLDNFSQNVVDEIDAVYRECTEERERADAFRLFGTLEDLTAFKEEGWIVANHSAAHYPVSEDSAIDMFARQFAECDADLREQLAAEHEFWVAPFDRAGKRARALMKTFDGYGSGAHLVLVGNEVNPPRASDHTVIKRIFVPMDTPRVAIRFLKRLPYGSTERYRDA